MTPEEIKAIRAQLGWTQKSLADAVGVSVRTVKFWEAGERNPSGSALILLRNLSDSAVFE